jgi:hypothetical protein
MEEESVLAFAIERVLESENCVVGCNEIDATSGTGQ